MPVGRFTKYRLQTVLAAVHEVIAKSACCSARVLPCGKRRSGVTIVKPRCRPAPTGVAIHAAYEPDTSAMPMKNGGIWCHVVNDRNCCRHELIGPVVVLVVIR